jgi:hypothetical protein
MTRLLRFTAHIERLLRQVSDSCGPRLHDWDFRGCLCGFGMRPAHLNYESAVGYETATVRPTLICSAGFQNTYAGPVGPISMDWRIW